MLFRSLTLFRLPPAAAQDVAKVDWETVLGEHRLRPCGPQELSTQGFVSPFGKGEDKAMSHKVGPFVLVNTGTESKLLPAAVLNEEVQIRIDKIWAEEERKVGGKERKRMKDEVLLDLLPRAFTRHGRQALYIDTKSGWVVLDTAGRKGAEASISAIREALGSFPAVPLAPEEAPRTILTDWLATGNLPEGLVLGEECELKDPTTSAGAVIKAKNQDLQCDEIRDHLRNGKQVTQLALTFADRMSFVVGEDLSIRKLKFLDVVLDEAGASHESAEAEMDANFALLTLELEKFIAKLTEWFKVPAPTDDATPAEAP
jgi:recombination associated protein RdgC